MTNIRPRRVSLKRDGAALSRCSIVVRQSSRSFSVQAISWIGVKGSADEGRQHFKRPAPVL